MHHKLIMQYVILACNMGCILIRMKPYIDLVPRAPMCVQDEPDILAHVSPSILEAQTGGAGRWTSVPGREWVVF